MGEFESVWSDLQGVPFSQGYLDAGGVRTRYLHAGDPGSPALVFLHGSGGHDSGFTVLTSRIWLRGSPLPQFSLHSSRGHSSSFTVLTLRF